MWDGGVYVYYEPFKVRGALWRQPLCLDDDKLLEGDGQSCLEAANQPHQLFIFMKTECQ